ncbi:MAG: ribose-5-phosphate isomerase RpiA [Alphaproteobacteria bacterium]|nr:ribose-5-phosphate isomerase RpiA [Alphaproteobacteria bacterium]
MPESDIAALKRAAAARALEFVQEGMKLGLGTGSTAEAFLELLGERVRGGLTVICSASSERTALNAKDRGIPIAPLAGLAPLDLTVDGADEADRDFNLIKGGGGALLREKIVANASNRMIVIADGSKLVERLGRFPLPVEVAEFGHGVTAEGIRRSLRECGHDGVAVALRQSGDAAYRTDGGNVIYDCALGSIAQPKRVADALKSITGVVEHGLFIDLATTLIVAHTFERIEVLERARNA